MKKNNYLSNKELNFFKKNGYLVKPYLIEFWQDMPFRLHDRVEFRFENKNWIAKKLYP